MGESEPNSNLPQNKSKLLFKIILVSGFVVVITGFLGIMLLQKSQKENDFSSNLNSEDKNQIIESNEPNPKIEILAVLPAEDPHIRYNILFDPSHTAVYSINKDLYTASSSSTVVINNYANKTYTEIDKLTISPDGKRVAYVAKEDDKEFVVVDGIERKKYDYVKNLRFSPDSAHIAYAAGEGIYFHLEGLSADEMTKTMFIVVDGVESKKYDGTYVEGNVAETYNPSFSQDGTKITYTAINKGKKIIVEDNEELSKYAEQLYPRFIGDTYNLVYLAIEKNKYFLVVAGQGKTAHDYISEILDMPYFLGNDETQIAYQATDNQISKIVAGDLSYPILSRDSQDLAFSPPGVLQDLAFSPSGQDIAYYTGTWQSKDLYINGKLFGNIKSSAAVTISSPLFSPNGQLLIYSQYNQNEQNASLHFLSVNSLQEIFNFPLPGYKVIGPMRFSDDGHSVYFKTFKDREIVFVTLDIERLIPVAKF